SRHRPQPAVPALLHHLGKRHRPGPLHRPRAVPRQRGHAPVRPSPGRPRLPQDPPVLAAGAAVELSGAATGIPTAADSAITAGLWRRSAVRLRTLPFATSSLVSKSVNIGHL